MKKFYVYVHTCNANGKKYVGCTTQARPELRWKEGRGYKHQLFGRAILKYGWDNITHEVFEVDSEEEMYRKEVELISFYHSNDPKFGYNNSVGGEKGTLGCKHPEETRKKMSEAAKERWLDPEYREKQSEVHKGKSVREETRKRISETLKKRAKDPEFLKKLSEVKKGKPLPKVKIKLPDGTVVEITKPNLGRNYIRKGKKFEYVP